MTQEYDATTERKLWFSGGSERPENCPVDNFQRRTGRQAPELGAEPANKLLQNLVSLQVCHYNSKEELAFENADLKLLQFNSKTDCVV